MRTTLDINNEVLQQVMQITKEKKKAKAVNTALREFIREKKKKNLLFLRGKMHIESNWEKLRQEEIYER